MKSIDTIGKVTFPNDNMIIQGAKLFSNEKGIFLEFDSPRSDSHKNHDIILGVFNQLGSVTCLNNIYYESQVGGGGNLCKYKVINLLVGVHFTQKEDIKFNKAYISANSLLEWFDKANIKLDYQKPITTVQYGTFQKIDLELTNFDKCSFNFGYATETSKHHISVNDTVTFRLDTDIPQPLENILDIIIKLRKLFAFLTSLKFEIEDIILYNKNYKYEFGGKPSDALVDIKFYKQIDSVSPLPSSHILDIKYIDIEDIFVELVGAWIKISENNFIIDLLMEKTFNPEISIKTYFLNICFALEVYHKRYINNQKLTNEEFCRIMDYLKETVTDPGAKEWIEHKIGLGNYPSFRDRLQFFKEDFEKIFSHDIELLINKIINTRNLLVHSTAKTKYVIKDDFEIYSTSLILEIIIKKYILKDLGISETNLEHIDKEAKTHIDSLFSKILS